MDANWIIFTYKYVHDIALHILNYVKLKILKNNSYNLKAFQCTISFTEFPKS